MFVLGIFQEELYISLYNVHGNLLEFYCADKSHQKTFDLTK